MLVTDACTHATRIGAPGDGRATGVRFSVREKFDTGHVVRKYHARATYPPQLQKTRAS